MIYFKIDLRLTNNLGENALHFAVKLNHINTVSRILDLFKSSKVTLQSQENGAEGEGEIQSPVKLPYDPLEVLKKRNKEGEMPIHQAASLDKTAIVKAIKGCLRQFGVDADSLKTEQGQTAEEIIQDNIEARKEKSSIKKKEKEQAYQKRLREKELKEQEIKKKKEVEEKLKILDRKKKEAEERIQKEQEKKKPLKLLIFFVGALIFLYFLLKIAIRNKATGSGGSRYDSGPGRAGL